VSVSVGPLEGFQLELAYSLVGKNSLDWLPQVDELFTLYCGERLRTVPHGGATWTNAGPRHSLRVGSQGGLEDLATAQTLFSAELQSLTELAAQLDAQLLPAGMHPWMSAERAEPWPHGQAAGDQAMANLFGGARHGFCNQNPLRLSLPFASEFEFERLFGALRFVMPLLPALSASSPFAEGRRGPAMSCRVAARRDYFASNLDFAESLVPRGASGREEYVNEVIKPIERTFDKRNLAATLDPLQVCAHGIAADFDAGLVHIHLLDMQECLQADLAVCAAVTATTTLIQSEQHAPLRQLSEWPRARLDELLELTLVQGSRAVLRDHDFLKAFGFPEGAACRTSELWQHLVEEKIADSVLTQQAMPALSTIVGEGSLARRMLNKLPDRWDDEDLYNLYRQVVACLASDELL
jgi:carboxylate-amine ligase